MTALLPETQSLIPGNVVHPATYWAKYLLSRRQFTYDQILAQMTVRGLGGLESSDLEALEWALEFPTPFLGHMRDHRESQVWLREERIYELWHPCEHMKIAWKVIDHPKHRKAVETMALSPFRADKVVQKLNRTIGRETGIKMTERSFRLFCHFFWNNERMTSEDWGSFVMESERKNAELLSLAANLSGPNAGQMLLWKMGIGSLRRIEGHQGYLDIRANSLAALAQIAHDTPSTNHATMMLRYAKAFDIAQKGIEATGGAQEDMVQSFRNFMLDHDNPEIEPLDALPGGSVSIPSIGGDDEQLD